MADCRRSFILAPHHSPSSMLRSCAPAKFRYMKFHHVDGMDNWDGTEILEVPYIPRNLHQDPLNGPRNHPKPAHLIARSQLT